MGWNRNNVGIHFETINPLIPGVSNLPSEKNLSRCIKYERQVLTVHKKHFFGL